MIDRVFCSLFSAINISFRDLILYIVSPKKFSPRVTKFWASWLVISHEPFLNFARFCWLFVIWMFSNILLFHITGRLFHSISSHWLVLCQALHYAFICISSYHYLAQFEVSASAKFALIPWYHVVNPLYLENKPHSLVYPVYSAFPSMSCLCWRASRLSLLDVHC